MASCCKMAPLLVTSPARPDVGEIHGGNPWENPWFHGKTMVKTLLKHVKTHGFMGKTAPSGCLIPIHGAPCEIGLASPFHIASIIWQNLQTVAGLLGSESQNGLLILNLSLQCRGISLFGEIRTAEIGKQDAWWWDRLMTRHAIGSTTCRKQNNHHWFPYVCSFCQSPYDLPNPRNSSYLHKCRQKWSFRSPDASWGSGFCSIPMDSDAAWEGTSHDLYNII